MEKGAFLACSHWAALCLISFWSLIIIWWIRYLLLLKLEINLHFRNMSYFPSCSPQSQDFWFASNLINCRIILGTLFTLLYFDVYPISALANPYRGFSIKKFISIFKLIDAHNMFFLKVKLRASKNENNQFTGTIRHLTKNNYMYILSNATISVNQKFKSFFSGKEDCWVLSLP